MQHPDKTDRATDSAVLCGPLAWVVLLHLCLTLAGPSCFWVLLFTLASFSLSSYLLFFSSIYFSIALFHFFFVVLGKDFFLKYFQVSIMFYLNSFFLCAPSNRQILLFICLRSTSLFTYTVIHNYQTT